MADFNVGSRTKITPGYGQTWTFGSRAFGGRGITIGKISDVDGSWTFATPASFTGGLTKAGDAVLAGNPFVVAVVAGAGSAASTVVAGAVVGDKVVSAINLTGLTNVTASFEGTVTVAGHVQQSAVDLSADAAILITLVHQS